MREVFATSSRPDLTRDALRWGVRQKKWTRVARAAYVSGSGQPLALEQALAVVTAAQAVAAGSLAAALHGFDSVDVGGHIGTVPPGGSQRSGIRRTRIDPTELTTINGFSCTGGARTLIDLGAMTDDAQWEQVLESALRLRATSICELTDALTIRRIGNGRARRVLASRPLNAPPTDSLLETLAVQLIRRHGLPEPLRQVEVVDCWNRFVARVDLAWPDTGLFLELDGQHHNDQPVYDARRETAIVAATGWIPGRFTWTEVTRHPTATSRRIAQLLSVASARSSTNTP